jgi:hypothetical protein
MTFKSCLPTDIADQGGQAPGTRFQTCPLQATKSWQRHRHQQANDEDNQRQLNEGEAGGRGWGLGVREKQPWRPIVPTATTIFSLPNP